MTVLVYSIGAVFLCFTLVVLVGPPYLPTLNKQMTVALDMLDLKPGQTLLELGCGDGKVLIAAAQRGWKVVGIELNPLLVLLCYVRTWRYRKQVRVVWGNYWQTGKWPPADGVFGFVLPRLMPKLDRLLSSQYAKGAVAPAPTHGKRPALKLASFAFVIPGKKVVRQQDGVFLYEYR